MIGTETERHRESQKGRDRKMERDRDTERRDRETGRERETESLGSWRGTSAGKELGFRTRPVHILVPSFWSPGCHSLRGNN